MRFFRVHVGTALDADLRAFAWTEMGNERKWDNIRTLGANVARQLMDNKRRGRQAVALVNAARDE